ncbi:MAG: hypothetical protein IJC16_06560 [Rikenellaceae bacterium]|nr:hypothetical protein [Rikenellaceae bacterium]
MSNFIQNLYRLSLVAGLVLPVAAWAQAGADGAGAALADTVSDARTVPLDAVPVARTALKLTPLDVAYFKETAYTLAAGNASALVLGRQVAYSDLSLGLGIENGSFHRPQQAAHIFNYGLDAEGAMTLGKLYVSGGFRFLQSKEDDVKFNSILDPYRGTPYIIADSTGGDWTKQAYDLWAQGTSPLIADVVAFGLRAGINVNRGAKKIDPRPQSNSNAISVSPSVTLRYRAHALSGDYTYRRFRENTNLMLYNSSEAQKIYLLKGMGQYIYDIFSANERERQYKGDGHTAGVEYHFDMRRFHLLVRGTYENYVEEASDIENNKPRKRGRIYENNYGARLVASYTGDRLTHQLEAEYRDDERSGREIIQVFNSDAGVNAWQTDSEAPRRSVVTSRAAELRYALMVMASPERYKWRVALDGRIERFADEYAVLDSYNRFRRGVAGLEVVRTLEARKCYYRVGLNGMVNRVWDKSMNYVTRESEDRTIENGFVRPDIAMLWQNYYGLGADLMWGYRFRRGESVYVRAAYGYKHAADGFSRHATEVRVGYSF